MRKANFELGLYKIWITLTALFHGVNADVFAKTYGMQCIGLRYFNVFGKRQDPNGASCPVKCICVFIFHGNAAVIPLWVKNLIEYKQPVINGDGSYSRDGIYPPSFRRAYINNIIQANEKALFTPKEQVLKGKQFTVLSPQLAVHKL